MRHTAYPGSAGCHVDGNACESKCPLPLMLLLLLVLLVVRLLLLFLMLLVMPPEHSSVVSAIGVRLVVK